MRALYAQVMGAQLLATTDDVGSAWYPFYLPQGLWGAFASYITDLTKAGITLELVPEGVAHA